jgi:hypothetical protein
MLTAWSAAGIVGPTLIARIRESTGAYRNALYVISVIMLVSAVIPFIVRPAGGRRGSRPGAVTGAATVAHHLNGEPPAQAGAGAGAVRVRP